MKEDIKRITKKYFKRFILLIIIITIGIGISIGIYGETDNINWIDVVLNSIWAIMMYFYLFELGGLIKNEATKRRFKISISIIFAQYLIIMILLKAFENFNEIELISTIALNIAMVTIIVSIFCIAQTMKISESLVPFFLYFIGIFITILGVIGSVVYWVGG